MNRFLSRFGAIFLALTLVGAPALAQQRTEIQFRNAAGINVPVSDATPLPTTQAAGSSSATTTADGADVTQGAVADAVYNGSGNATVNSILKGIWSRASVAVSRLEDNPANSGDNGQAALCVRQANYYSTTTSSAVGDYDVCHTAPDGSVIVNFPDGTPVTVTAGAAVNAVLFSVDTLGSAGVAFQTTGTFVATIIFEVSNDNTNWTAGYALGGSTNGINNTATASNVMYFIPANARYARARLTAYTSGSVTAVALLRSTPPQSPVPSGLQLNNGTNVVGFMASASVFTETTAAIGASVTFTGTSRDAGSTITAIPFTTFGCRANVNQVGTLVIEDSVDNAAWFRAASAATTTDPLVSVDLQVNLRARYNRCNFINGATATTVQRIVSSYRD